MNLIGGPVSFIMSGSLNCFSTPELWWKVIVRVELNLLLIIYTPSIKLIITSPLCKTSSVELIDEDSMPIKLQVIQHVRDIRISRVFSQRLATYGLNRLGDL